MNYRHIVQFCLLIQVLGSSSWNKPQVSSSSSTKKSQVSDSSSRKQPQLQSSGWCKTNKNVCNQDSFCHRRSKMCVCRNGNSHYPMCKEMKGCEPNCDQTKTWCTAMPKCCNVKCSNFESCMDGKCECKYGEDRRGRCNRCMRRCRRGTVCKRRRGKYQCVRKPTKPKPVNCVPFCGEGSKCKKVNGIVTCTACGPDKVLKNRFCNQIEYKWNLWASWSSCSITCGMRGMMSGNRTRMRSCNYPGRCTGKKTDQGACPMPMCPMPSGD